MEIKMPSKTKAKTVTKKSAPKNKAVAKKSTPKKLPFVPASEVAKAVAPQTPDSPLTKKNPTIEDLLAGTEAGRIWNDIKDREIFMFALPDQRVYQHVKPVLVDTEKLFLVLNSTAALPSLEESVGRSDVKRGIKAYKVELADRFVIVTPAPLPLGEKTKK